MLYTTREGEAGEAHINYECPCGCTAGLIFHRRPGPSGAGECCCGRLLWVGANAEAQVQAQFAEGTDYEVDRGEVTLPWEEVVQTALAVPRDTLEHEQPSLAEEDGEPRHEADDATAIRTFGGRPTRPGSKMSSAA